MSRVPICFFAVWGPVLGYAGAVGLAQEPAKSDSLAQPTSHPSAEPYWLRVTADVVNLRSRPDLNSIPVARAGRDTALRAFGQEYNWHRIRPPEGVFSFVSAAHVERRSETEGVVAVQAGALRVRVGSLVQDIDPQHAEVQVLLPRGTPVRILGSQGDWLRIAAPPDVYLYVSAEHVERISNEVAARLGGVDQPDTRPTLSVTEPQPPLPRGSACAAPRGLKPAALSPPVAATGPAEGPDLSGLWGQRLVAVEKAIGAEARRPVPEQSWEAVLADLRPIAAQQEEPMVARLAAAWIDQLREYVADQAMIDAAEEVLRKAARERARHEREMERIGRLRERAASQPATAPGADRPATQPAGREP